MSDPASIRRLVRVAGMLRALADEDAAAVGIAIEDRLKNGGNLEDLLGIRSEPGQSDISTRLVYEQRDDLLRDTAARFYPAQKSLPQATQLHAELENYFNSAIGWKRHRALDEYPDRAGTVRAACWSILKARDQLLSIRSIRDILSRS